MIFIRKPPQCPRCRSIQVQPQTKGRLVSWGWGTEDDLFRWKCRACDYSWKNHDVNLDDAEEV